MTSPLPVIIGEDPGHRDPRLPPDTSTPNGPGTRLQEILGVDIHHFVLVNLFYRRQPSWNTKNARDAACHLRPLLIGRPVIFLGRRVASAFGHRDCAYSWEWHSDHRHRSGFWAARIPHPSGTNHVWNDDAERRASRAFVALMPHESVWSDRSPTGRLVSAQTIGELHVRVAERDVLFPPTFTLGEWACTVRDNRAHDQREKHTSRDLQRRSPLHP